MNQHKVVLGIAPTKRSFLSKEEALRQKKRFMGVIENILRETVELVTIDDISENGICWNMEETGKITEKFKNAGIDALFIPFCDFGEEQVAARIASSFHNIPTLIWGARDERPNTDESRGRDTQCGMFAATKVLRRYGVVYSYIYNCETESREFAEGYDCFIRVAAVLKTLKTLRIAKIGNRPEPFMSVMTNEADLLKRFGITIVPVSPVEVSVGAEKIVEENGKEFQEYYQDLITRMDASAMEEKKVKLAAAVAMSLAAIMQEKECSVGAFECWSAFPSLIQVCPCVALGEMADMGLPLSCETDVNGAVTLAILQACNLWQEPPFLADLTIRHPENDNAELLWHCGPFPYSLKAEDSRGRLVDGQERFRLRDGHISVCRFDDAEGKYYLFAGEGDTVEGPETNGTYVYLEVNDWKCWEEKLMFGPYIHHLGCAYGNYKKVFQEAARYLDIIFDDADVPGICSL